MSGIAFGLVVSIGMVGMAAGEGVCFRSVGEAVRGSGVVDGSGFRVEAVAWDVIRGAGWARVRSCEHPERPAVLMRDEGGRPAAEGRLRDRGAVAKAGQRDLVVRAGALVRVVSVGERVRMEFGGRAVESGGVGDRVRVRVGADGEERLVMCVAKGADVLEVVR